MKKRKVDVLILSDIHLGTYGCRAKELITYLKSIKPKMVVLNGDIIDIWNFSKRYFPKSHFGVLRQLLKFAADGTPLYYVTGNHDEMLRRFSDFSSGKFHLVDKLVIELDGKKAWIFHGDVFDASMKQAKWLAKLGGVGYDLLIGLNVIVNFGLCKLGMPRMSFSKKVKDNVKKAVSYIQDFEEIAGDIAIDQGYDYVICGHIHNPQKRIIQNQKGQVVYLNSGDWIENLTALEYSKKEWQIYQFEENHYKEGEAQPDAAPSVEQVTRKVIAQEITSVRYANFVE
ncbi:MAG: UDP-2,3-diacylglucosamine diphosphatase [Bacteroidota bacterium]